MKLKILFSLLVILAFSATPAFAQDPGILDTIILVPTVIPDATTETDQLQIDVYAYTDETITGFSMGFNWDNPNVVLDNAIGNPSTTGTFTINAFYENGDIALANANRQFLYGGLDFGPGLAGASERRLWASYFFTVSNWDTNSVINLDTMTFSGSSAWMLTILTGTVQPVWAGALEIRDTAYQEVIPANLVISETVLNFTAVEGGANPANQLFNVASDGDPLDFDITEAIVSGWLTATPTTGPTPQDITVSINIGGQTAGPLSDTLIITSAGADNSPQKVIINLTVTADPKNLAVSADTLKFTAVEDGANPSAQALTVSEVDGDAIAYEVTETSDNVSLVNATGTTPGDVSVSVDMGALIPGTYYYDLTVSSDEADNTPLTVVVMFTITERDRELVVSPDTLYFTAEEDGAHPAAMYLVISELGDDNIAYEIDIASIASWLAIDNATSTTPDSSRVAVSPAGMTEGVYLDSVMVSSASAVNSPYAFVEFTVTPRPKVLVIAPDTLKFTAIEGGTNPDNQFFEVTEEGGASIGYAVFESTDWFSVDSPVGTTPDSTYVIVDITDVPAGTYYGDVTFNDEVPKKTSYIRTVMLSVVPPENDPPVLEAIGPKEVAEGADLTFTIHATDPDGTIPALSAYDLPEGATFDDSLNGTGLFVWWPTYDQEGIYHVTFVASDGSLSDTEIVEITVTNTNRLPYFISEPNDTTIDECMSLELIFIGSDPDGDAFTAGMVGPLPDNMTYSVFADTIVTLTFTPDTTQADVYEVMAYATEGEGFDTAYSTVTITLEDCFPCSPMILSDTAFFFVDTIDVDVTGDGSVAVSSPGALCFTVDNAFDTTLPDWFSFAVVEPCTPGGEFTFSYDMTGYPEGYYSVLLSVLGEPNVCDPNPQFVSIGVQLIDTTTPEVPSDSVIVATTPAVPGAQVIVPVEFVNSCNLFGVSSIVEWDSDYLVLDSVSWTESAVGHFVPRYDTIYQFGKNVLLFAMDDTAQVSPGSWNFANLYFSVAVETPPGSFLPIVQNSVLSMVCESFICASDTIIVIPEEVTGGIIVDSSYNFVCGYVVDTAGIPIPGATVELYGDFPMGPAEDMTTTNGSGAFALSDFYTVPFDLWAYHPGYYPGLVENINFGEIGIMITLTPVDEITPTLEWVNFYCDNNTYFDQPLPVGSIVDAYDPDGIHCGSYYVTEAGSYGFMPVYRDDEFSPEDEGADPGDNIRFFVNGMEAQAHGETIWTEMFDSWQVCLEAGEITIYCDLHEGWNLVSWSVDHESDYILDALASIDECLELVLGFEHGGLTYDPNYPVFSTLWEVDHLSGYWIKVNCDITLEISGAPVSGSTPIQVYSGWNLVSYLPDFGMGIIDGFSSLDGNLIVATGEDGIYIPDDISSTLLDLEPCKGYWVKVETDDDLVYPVAGPAIASQKPRSLGNSMAASISDITPTTNWINLYANELTIDGEVVKSGTVISAYTQNGVKAGTYTMAENGLFGFMPVYADDISTETVEGVRAGESFYLTIDGVEAKETFTFVSGNGARVEISNLTAGDHTDVLPTNFSLSQNYPNPFNPTTTIEFSLPTASKTKIEVYNILGKLVSVPFDGMAGAGENSIVWDGTNSHGQKVSSGIYFYRLTADEYTETKKMTLLK